MGGGGSQPKATIQPQVSRRVESGRDVLSGGTSRRALGSQFLQQRKATPSGSGFGGTKKTLG